MKKSKPKAYSYIRFSTPEQKKGDSLRRQIQGAEDWATKHGVELDNSLKPDEGVSAFKGDHRTKGALREFLKLVESSKIPKGSILIVESLDRLSREQVMDALGQFIQIISKGIKVVTLSDKMEYTEESINANFGQLLMSIVIMSRAHEESATKSKRLKDTWENKRDNIQNKKLTGQCPAWLKRSDDWKKFDKIKIRCQTIEDIFKMKLSGKSPRTIEKQLNGMQGKWKPENGWRTSYIKKILKNPAVIGEYQPHKMVEGKRQPVGDPVLNYFPAVVSTDLFYAVQDQIRKNSLNYHGGRTGKVNNLFSHMAKCGYCGSPMHYVDKGKPPKGGKSLVCDRAKRGNGCKYRSWRYDEFESDVFRLISRDLDVTQLLPDYDQIESEISTFGRKESSIQGKLNKAKSEIKNLTDSIASTPDKRIRTLLEDKLAGRLDEKEKLEKQEAKIEVKIHELKQININVSERISNVKELFGLMQDLKDQDEEALIDLRFRLRQMLRNLIDRIDVYPGGYKDDNHVNELYPSDEKDIYCEGIDNKDFRFYQIRLKGCKSVSRGWYPPETYQRLKALDRRREKEHGGFFPELN
jgi:DNA invertase Pin-like site-specific DNA recombinase